MCPPNGLPLSRERRKSQLPLKEERGAPLVGCSGVFGRVSKAAEVHRI